MNMGYWPLILFTVLVCGISFACGWWVVEQVVARPDEQCAALLEALEEIVSIGTEMILNGGATNTKDIAEAYSKADRVAREAIRKAKSHADTLKGD